MCWQLDPTEGPGRVRQRMMRAPLTIHRRHILSNSTRHTGEHQEQGKYSADKSQWMSCDPTMLIPAYVYLSRAIINCCGIWPPIPLRAVIFLGCHWIVCLCLVYNLLVDAWVNIGGFKCCLSSLPRTHSETRLCMCPPLCKHFYPMVCVYVSGCNVWIEAKVCVLYRMLKLRCVTHSNGPSLLHLW